MSFKNLTLALFVSLSTLASQAKAQLGESVTFDWTQYSTGTSYRAQGQCVFDGGEHSVFDVTYDLNGRAQSAQLTIDFDFDGDLSFSFYNRRNGSTCPGHAVWQGGVFRGSMACRSGNHPVTISF